MEKLTFPALIITFLLLATAYSVIIPLGEAPDEVTHWSYVRYLITHQRLPMQEGNVLGESHQPPLYYAMNALLVSLIPAGDTPIIANPDFVLGDPTTPNLLLHPRREGFPYRDDVLAWHLARLLSVAMGAVTVWATARIGIHLFPHDRGLGLSAAGFTAFLPSFLFISAVVNNDNLVVMLTSLGLLNILRLAGRPRKSSDTVLMGILLGFTLLAKLSGVVMWLIAAAMLVWRARGNWKQVGIDLALCFGSAFVLIAPWLLYNQQSYGDPFAWSSYLSVVSARQAPMTQHDWVGIIAGLFTSFGGRFGGALELELPRIVYLVFGIAAVIALLGWLGYARDARKRQLEPGIRTLTWLSTSFWLLLILLYMRWALSDLAAGQVRLLFPGLSLFAIVLTAGIARVYPSQRWIGLTVWTGGPLVLALGVLVYLSSVYAPPVQNLNPLPQLDNASTPVTFGQVIRILDYRIEQTRVTPGDSVTVEVYWQAQEDPKENYWILLQLEDKGTIIANKDGVPSAGQTTTDWWQKGQVYKSRHTLEIPKQLSSGTYTLRLGLHPFGKWEWLYVRGQDMLDLGKIVVTAP